MFNWFDKLLVKIAKKILNKYAPEGEFIAYINEQEEKVLKDLGGYGQPVNETGVKSFIPEWMKTAKDTYDEYKGLVDAAAGAAKYYIDYKDQKRRNEIEEQAYKDYMAQVKAAGKEAQAAIDLNLMPMEVTNVPTTKADVSDFTAVAARGGLMNLPTRQRKRYAYGPNEIEIEAMDEEVLTPYDLKMEEGVNIGEQVFHDTGDDRMNAQNVWQSGQVDQNLYQMDFEIFFKSGDWQDHISRGTVQGDMQYMAAKGGIIGLRKGGRVKYAQGSGIMNLGGLEKDYRTTGGFVPIGGRERADDVPARLSKNEFVMTADAVRAAGGGSINRGAQRMYDTMKHLEASPTAKRMIS